MYKSYALFKVRGVNIICSLDNPTHSPKAIFTHFISLYMVFLVKSAIIVNVKSNSDKSTGNCRFSKVEMQRFIILDCTAVG